jgi:hypothetical protein
MVLRTAVMQDVRQKKNTMIIDNLRNSFFSFILRKGQYQSYQSILCLPKIKEKICG